ncbi:dihydroflavonol-4-reductase [Cladophialophora yegresii CBS 114405]|uniref:Dihydroflavonol-4-reductase n=1 Tax=Cladophialophora yegresii CBS 114405 TaxID=1182544 RepID=W9VYZ9_9EURO|nr:dihydroflavonol-4-reductase [Cladophialophora yegresii CBS 114405]EXJ57930.1 dihydroflavonol-4-reductase [Cladophialophora yegresii CBS 114405]
MKVLLTGGSGFVAVHCVDLLLQHGHEVVATVRSDEKGHYLQELFKGKPLSYVIVKDIAAEGAFDEAVQTEPPFEAVVHTASPFHFNITNNKDLLDPAINGTTGILKAVHKSAKTVNRVVITSSFAAISNYSNPPKVYTEEIWNDQTMEEALTTTNPQAAYRASKKFAEKAAWDFLESEKPNFTLATLCPPMIYGPVLHQVKSLDDLNTSSARMLRLYQGIPRSGPVGSPMHVDVRDLALAHVLAIENPEAANQRFLVAAQLATEKELRDIIENNFPEIRGKLRDEVTDTLPPWSIDNSKSVNVLGLKYRPLEDTIVDTVNSLKALGA